MNESAAPGGALAGVRVIDLATPRAELCGRVLADLGAVVLKLEPPQGTAARKLPPFANRADGSPSSESLYWDAVGRGKHAAQLDIFDTPFDIAQHDQLHELLDGADILIESFTPGVMDSLGLGYRQLAARYPQLIVVSVTPFGQTGPKAQIPATDLTLEAAGGLLAMQGDGDRPPLPIGYPQASFHAGVQAAADAVIALHARRSSGRGQHLDVSMQAAVVWTLMNATNYWPMVGIDPPAASDERAHPPPSPVQIPRAIACADGYVFIGIHLPGVGERTLHRLVQHAIADGNEDPALTAVDWNRWITLMAAGEITADQVNAATAAAIRWMATKPKAELVQLAVDEAFLLAAAQSIGDLFVDPQLQARDFWQHSADRRRAGPFAKLSATPLRVDRPVPKLGNKLDVLAFIERWRREPATAASDAHARPAFAGLKVADFAWVGVGPMIAKALADHGATVVHVESSMRPDVLRLLPPFKDGVPGLDRAQFMANFNTSKLGLALDMSTADGRTMARGVADWADVVIESFTPGNMTKFGLDYATLSAKRPDLVMVSTCMRGQTGPQNRYGGFGGQGAAMAGFVEITGWPDRPPVGPWGAYTDFITPRYGVAALAAALHHRRETGQGQYIDLSQIEAGIQFIEPLLNDFDVNGRQAQRAGHNSMYASPNGVYACAGIERYVALAVETAAQWRALARLLGDTAPVGFTDGAHLDSMPARRAVAHTIDAAISRWCASRDAFAAANALQQAGVPAHAVMRPSDLYFDAQLNHRNFFAKLAHPVMGNTPYDGFVTQFSGRMHGPYTAAPTLGQHSHQVLCDMLGVSEQMYADLLAAGVLR